MTDLAMTAYDWRVWVVASCLAGVVMLLVGAVALVRSRSRRERCACGERVRLCRPCGKGRCYRCDPRGMSDCDRGSR
jgi:hypothetical protein